jgi:hypothetical protein
MYKSKHDAEMAWKKRVAALRANHVEEIAIAELPTARQVARVNLQANCVARYLAEKKK